MMNVDIYDLLDKYREKVGGDDEKYKEFYARVYDVMTDLSRTRADLIQALIDEIEG